MTTNKLGTWNTYTESSSRNTELLVSALMSMGISLGIIAVLAYAVSTSIPGSFSYYFYGGIFAAVIASYAQSKS